MPEIPRNVSDISRNVSDTSMGEMTRDWLSEADPQEDNGLVTPVQVEDGFGFWHRERPTEYVTITLEETIDRAVINVDVINTLAPGQQPILQTPGTYGQLGEPFEESDDDLPNAIWMRSSRLRRTVRQRGEPRNRGSIVQRTEAQRRHRDQGDNEPQAEAQTEAQNEGQTPAPNTEEQQAATAQAQNETEPPIVATPLNLEDVPAGPTELLSGRNDDGVPRRLPTPVNVDEDVAEAPPHPSPERGLRRVPNYTNIPDWFAVNRVGVPLTERAVFEWNQGLARTSVIFGAQSP